MTREVTLQIGDGQVQTSAQVAAGAKDIAKWDPLRDIRKGARSLERQFGFKIPATQMQTLGETVPAFRAVISEGPDGVTDDEVANLAAYSCFFPSEHPTNWSVLEWMAKENIAMLKDEWAGRGEGTRA